MLRSAVAHVPHLSHALLPRKSRSIILTRQQIVITFGTFSEISRNYDLKICKFTLCNCSLRKAEVTTASTRHHVMVTNRTDRKKLLNFGFRQTTQGALLVPHCIKTVFEALKNVVYRGHAIGFVLRWSGASVGVLRHSGDNVFASDALNAKHRELLLSNSRTLRQAQCLRA